MKIDKIVDVFIKCGFNVNNIEGRHFLNRGWINYSFPFLSDIYIDDKLVDSLKWKYLLSIIKTESYIKNTYEFLLDTNDYGIDKFKSKKRNDIRRSIKDCTFKRPSLEDMLNYGLKINQQTLARHDRNDKYLTDKKYWRRYITSIFTEEDILILGAYIAEKLVGYITVCKIEEEYFITDPYFDNQASASAPIQGLIYTLVNQLIEKNGVIKIYYGLDSFYPLPSLTKYKHSMLFTRVPATRVYIIYPLLLPFLKLIVFVYVRLFNKKSIKNPTVRKIIKLYQGHRILYKTLR